MKEEPKNKLKLKVNLTNDIKRAEISHLPKEVPLLHDFNIHRVVGKANVYEEGENIMADVYIENTDYLNSLKDMIHCAPAGLIEEKEGNKITKFNLTSVSITYR